MSTHLTPIRWPILEIIAQLKRGAASISGLNETGSIFLYAELLRRERHQVDQDTLSSLNQSSLNQSSLNQSSLNLSTRPLIVLTPTEDEAIQLGQNLLWTRRTMVLFCTKYEFQTTPGCQIWSHV